MLNRVHHVAAVVEDLQATVKILVEGFGFRVSTLDDYEDMKVAILEAHNVAIELIQPFPQSRYWKFLKSPGLNHLAVQVSSIEDALNKLKQLNIEPLAPPRSVKGGRIVDLDPKGTFGLKIQLISEGDLQTKR